MSGLTAEQRETLTNMADYGAAECGWGCGGFIDAELDALRAALVVRTCGTCKCWTQTWPGINPTRGRCENHQAPACDSETVADDGCLKGWTARPETTP